MFMSAKINLFYKMNNISVNVKTCKGVVHEIMIPVAGDSMEQLLESLTKAKEETNEYLTKLVNEEKCGPTRKQDELESSEDDDGQLGTVKKVKTSTDI